MTGESAGGEAAGGEPVGGRATTGRLGLSRDAWRDAARLGLQSGVAGAASFLAAEALGLEDAFLVIMMAVTSLQRSVGGTLGEAGMRLQSALAGSGLGLLALLFVPEGWGVAGALGVALAAVGAGAALRPAWALGVVPAVGMSLGDRGDLLGTAVTTSIGIALGALVGTLVSLLVWPDRAEARFERHFRQALRAVADRLSDAVAATVEPGRTPRVPEHVSAWGEAVWLAAEALASARFVDREGFGRRLDALRELHESVVILDRAAEAETPPAAAAALAPQVEALRRDACAVLTHMEERRAAGDREPAGRIEAIDATLERLRAAVAGEDPGAPEHEVHGAVAFGLREVRRTLAALVEAQRGPRGD
jgi:uncharacterized membrane protein YccC